MTDTLKSPKAYASIQDENEKSEAIITLLSQLKAIPKGERALTTAKKIRRGLRAMGYFISKAKDEMITS